MAAKPKKLDATVDPVAFKARMTEAAAAIPDRVLPRPNVVPLPVIAPSPMLAGQRAVRTRDQREQIRLTAYFRDDAPGRTKVTLSQLPQAGVVECRHTIRSWIEANRFPKPDGFDGVKRRRPYWKLETLRRFLDGAAS